MAATMLAVSFDYLAHFAMILGIAALLCAPGVILFLRKTAPGTTDNPIDCD